MKIPVEIFTLLNVVIILIFAVNIIISYRKGLVFELAKFICSIFAIYISFRIGTNLAVSHPLVHSNLGAIASFFDLDFILNSIIWTIGCYLLMKLAILILLPLLKFLSEVPILGIFNKIGGIVFGIINSIIIVMVISLLLSTPIFTNGEEVKNGTLIHYVSSFTDKVYQYIVNNTEIPTNIKDIDYQELLDDVDNISDLSSEQIDKILDDLGIQSADDLIKMFNNLTEEELEELNEIMKENGSDTSDDIDINDLTEEQKTKLMELYLKYRENK